MFSFLTSSWSAYYYIYCRCTCIYFFVLKDTFFIDHSSMYINPLQFDILASDVSFLVQTLVVLFYLIYFLCVYSICIWVLLCLPSNPVLYYWHFENMKDKILKCNKFKYCSKGLKRVFIQHIKNHQYVTDTRLVMLLILSVCQLSIFECILLFNKKNVLWKFFVKLLIN